jgi:hypothetical protein
LLRLGWSGNRLKEGSIFCVQMIEVKKASHCAYKIRYHMVFSIKYRRMLLQDVNHINYIKSVCSEVGKRYCFDFKTQYSATRCDWDKGHAYST